MLELRCPIVALCLSSQCKAVSRAQHGTGSLWLYKGNISFSAGNVCGLLFIQCGPLMPWFSNAIILLACMEQGGGGESTVPQAVSRQLIEIICGFLFVHGKCSNIRIALSFALTFPMSTRGCVYSYLPLTNIC